jgi:hypothetical protein
MNVYMTPKKLLQKVVLKEPHPNDYPSDNTHGKASYIGCCLGEGF